MHTELPADRLHRRLGNTAGSPAEPDVPEAAADAADDDPKALLPKWLPDATGPHDTSLRGWLAAVRADPGRSGAIALALVAALAVLVTVFTLIREDPRPVTSAKLPPVEMVASGSPRPSASPSTAPDQPMVVSVVGLVKAPGLVTVSPGARVAEAIEAAGGALPGADTVGLNMARHLADGEQVVVGITALPGAPPALGSSINGSQTPAVEPASPANVSGPLDLNTATVEQLDELPGIGPVTAQAIVSWRSQHGSFSSVDQLGDVDGIGPARLGTLRDLVRV